MNQTGMSAFSQQSRRPNIGRSTCLHWFIGLVICLVSFQVTWAQETSPQNIGRAGGQESPPALQAFDEVYAALNEIGARPVGSEAAASTASLLKHRAEQLPNVEVRELTYTLQVPTTDEAEIRFDGRSIAVYPLTPAFTRLNATPAEGLEGPLVYAGSATPAELPPEKLHGSIALIEASAGSRWSEPRYYGAKATIILGSGQETWAQLRSHELHLPVNVPRFYVPAGPQAEALRQAALRPDEATRATVRVAANWRARSVSSLLVLVKPSSPLAGPTPAPMITAGYESSSLVTDVAPGASQAANTAAAFALLEHLANNPVERPVLFHFGGADSVQLLSTRHAMLALAQSPRAWREEIAEIDRQAEQLEPLLARARQLQTSPAGLDPKVDSLLIERLVELVETARSLDQEVLFRLRRFDNSRLTPEEIQLKADLEQRQVELNAVRNAFRHEPEALDAPEVLADTAAFIEELVHKLAGGGAYGRGMLADIDERRAMLEQRIATYAWFAQETGYGAEADPTARQQRLIELMISLDLSDRGLRLGPVDKGEFDNSGTQNMVGSFRSWFDRQARAATDDPGHWFNGLPVRFDLGSINLRAPTESHMVAPLALPMEMAKPFGIPGIGIVTFDDLRMHRDTPADTADRLEAPVIRRQVATLLEVLGRAFGDMDFRERIEARQRVNGFTGQVVSPSPGQPVPSLPRPGFHVAYAYVTDANASDVKLRTLPFTPGVRRVEVKLSDADGKYIYEGLSSLTNNFRRLGVLAYKVEPDTGKLVAATDFGRQASDIKFGVDLNSRSIPPVRSLVFSAEQMTLVGLYDPRFLRGLNRAILLDARKNAEFSRFNVTLHDQMMSAFVEPDSRSVVVFRYGNVGNRLLLLNMAQAESDGGAAGQTEGIGAGRGFTTEEINDLRAIALQTSRDFHRLDQLRLAAYREAGVTNTFLDELSRQAGETIAHAAAALQGRVEGLTAQDIRSARLEAGETDLAEEPVSSTLAWPSQETLGASKYVADSTEAWAMESLVYSAAQAMANDVVRAVIFLLLLCVPFAFCLERLLIGSSNVYKQIGYLAGFFSVMLFSLWLFHPAFKITSSPLIIVLAFAIIFMSIVVISVVYEKFETELKKIRSGRGTAPGTSFARASVLMSAVNLGIANMRKRKFRTALTSITVVLITFAVLCFASGSTSRSTTSLPVGLTADGPGVVVRQRGFRPLGEEIIDRLKAVYPDKQFVQRWWNVSAAEPNVRTMLVAEQPDGTPKVVMLRGLLGLSPGESKLSDIADVIGPGFQRLEEGQQDVIYLSTQASDELGVGLGDVVRLGGLSLEVAGIYNGDAFDQRLVMLSGEPLAPLEYTEGALDAGGQRLSQTGEDTLDLDPEDSAAEINQAYTHLPGDEFAVVPAAVSRLMPDANLHTLGLRLQDDQQVDAMSQDLAYRFSLAVFASRSDGVQMISAGTPTNLAGYQVAVPLAIGGLIIFNTMMGSIAERKREIHVYTSLGLAPLHVGALFVAEALTYGLIGTIFGYVIGQGLGTVLVRFDLLGGMTLNYSGTSAMLTIGLILLVVLLSALVPARVASKIAAPSIDRTWKVPAPQDGRIIASLPFTINKTAAAGCLGYLAEYFDAHKEGSIGKFSADDIEPVKLLTPDGQEVSALQASVWLTPFDLGVRQTLLLSIRPGEFADIYEVEVQLDLESGPDEAWYRMNRSFLTELRKQFLQWRSLSVEKMQQYIEESQKLYAGARIIEQRREGVHAEPTPVGV